MNKNVIKPVDIGIIMLFFIGILFPAAFIYDIYLISVNGLNVTLLTLGIVSALMIYFISINVLNIVFLSKFTFYDEYFEVVYFDSFLKHIGNDFFKIVKPKTLKIKYSDIDKFGSFTGYQMRKNGRDEKNNLQIVISVSGAPVCFSLPFGFENARNYFVLNDINGDGFIIDGKLYSVFQVKKILQTIENYSNKQAVGGYPNLPNVIPLIVICGVVLTAFIPFALIGLECKLNPLHSRAVDTPSRMIYFLSCMFFLISILASILYSKSPNNDSKKTVKIVLSAVSAVLFIVFVISFGVTVMN